MNVIIAEDESLAAERLEQLVLTCDSSIRIIGRYDSVEEMVTFFRLNTVDLVFLDIQLADGKSFEIFNKVEVTAPVIFTTAYDQYALQAFKLHSIDYLLKPIQQHELAFALKKFNTLHSKSLNTHQWDVLKQLSKIPFRTYKQRFLVKTGNRLLYKPSSQVAYFYADGKIAYLVTRQDNRKFIIDHTLEELDHLLDPGSFFRISRKFIVNIESIAEVKGSISSRMEVNLSVRTELPLQVSRDKIHDFKKWLDR